MFLNLNDPIQPLCAACALLYNGLVMGYASYHEDIIDRRGNLGTPRLRYPDATTWYGQSLPPGPRVRTSKQAAIPRLTIHVGAARPKGVATPINRSWVQCACGLPVRFYKRTCPYCYRSLRTGKRVLWWGNPR